jgi:D-serine deaminase-like pyridoxal phosphate-dependent protein
VRRLRLSAAAMVVAVEAQSHLPSWQEMAMDNFCCCTDQPTWLESGRTAV